jgi:citrate synthase
MTSPSAEVRSRGDEFTPRLATKITQEVPNPENPYQAQSIRIHGYDHTALMQGCEVSDVIYLLFRGELPSQQERELFRELSIAMINPGPRHPASQASITAGVGKTISVNVLPIALTVYGGEFDGVANVEEAMRLYRRNARKPAAIFASTIQQPQNGVLSGFGTLYGDPDLYAEQLLQQLVERHGGQVLTWVWDLHSHLKPLGIGIQKSGICAAVLCDLGFQPRQGSGLMQLFAAPGLLAQGLEFANKPLTSMLFEPDENYHIEEIEEDADESC